MKNKITVLMIFLVLLILNNIDLFASSSYAIHLPSGKKSNLRIKKINGYEYITANELVSKVLKDAKYLEEKRIVEFENKKISFAVSSFFIACSSNDNMLVSQMNQPVIYYNKKVYLHFNSLLSALESLELYYVTIKKNKITLSEFLISDEKKSTVSEEVVQSDVTEGDFNELDFEIEFSKMNEIISKDSSLNLGINLKSNIPNQYLKIEEENSANKTIIDDNRVEANNNHVVANSTSEALNYPPNVYVIPQNLKIRELALNSIGSIQNDSEENKLQYANLDNSTAFAFSKSENDSKTKIIKIYAEYKSNKTEIHFYANDVIREYHKPEYEGKNLIVRLPNMSNDIQDYSRVNNVFPIENIKVEKIRNFLLYQITLSDELTQCKVRRQGPKEIIYSLFPINSAQKKINNPNKDSNIKPKVNEKPKDTKKEILQELNEQIDNWALDCIVLDPGHGGKDFGAIGISGVYEKDLTLKIARKVKVFLNSMMPEVKVVMTRNDDRFIELYKRGQIANREKGKLFISIHLNADRKKPSVANGIETYILRPGKNDDAIRVANFENSVIKFEKKVDKYKKLTDDELIIATMAQSAFVKFSELFARILQAEVKETSGLADRGVKQAGFYVLIGASMPNVLFEAAFLSNREDEKFASSEEGISKIAEGIAIAIKKYSIEYNKH